MLTKDKVLHSLQNMPEQFSLDELMEKLLLIEKVERGLDQVARGETYSTDQARQLLKQWPK
ncbi:MAG TPA: hypothetical protein VK364_14105 [Hymenobacter sp.]|nr:hypothetical protein [Hymenobacter sp.]